MNKKEKTLTEAVETFLQHKAQLGLQEPDWEEESHTFQFMHEQINDLYRLKTSDTTHHTGICAAFRKVHDYKYVTDPTFREALHKELTAQAVPAEELEKALDMVNTVIEEIKEENKNWNEKDAGFNPNLDEIIEVSNPGVEE